MDVSDSFSVSMEVFAHPFSHDGILFSVSWTPNFKLSWTTGQYLILEFVHSSLCLTVKSASSQHLQMIELSRTTPVLYDISDLHWHSVKASRRDGSWIVNYDDISKSEIVNSRTDVRLSNKQAFIGGRPGYFEYQFSGVVRRLKVNNQLVRLSDLPTQGQVEVVPCSSAQVQDFIAYIREEQDYFQTLGGGHGRRQ